jgi:hypothetical protein
MRNRSICMLLVGVVLIYGFAVRGSMPDGMAASGRVRLLETGQFHGDEVDARSGERWLGLYASRAQSALVVSRLRVVRVHDPIVDDRPSVKTGKEVRVARRPEPLLLVQNAPGLRAGRVTTVFVGRRSLRNRSDISLKLAGTGYRLKVVSKGTSKDGISNDAKLVISRGSSRQVLYSLVGKESDLLDGEWKLLWAGDLDHDNRLDLYVTVTDHYNVSERKLFLSSEAQRGRLVREVAEFVMVGC